MTLTLIDTFGFFFRSFYALPPLTSKNGFPTGLLTGFLNFLNTLQKDGEDEMVLFCLESKTAGFRESIYPDYKGNRPSAPEEFKLQLPIAIEWLQKLGYKAMSIDGFEADDIIASMVKKAKNEGLKVRIVTHDKDLYQLIDDGKVIVWDPTKKKMVDTAACIEKFGVSPEDFIDYQALVGDSVDNVPGVRGIGPVSAQKLINEHKTIENIYKNIETIEKKLVQKLKDGEESARMSKKLVSLRDDLEIKVDYEALRKPNGEIFLKIKDEMLAYDIKHLLPKSERLIEQPKKTAVEFAPILLDGREKLFTVLSKIEPEAIVAFDTETTSLDTKSAKLVGFSFAYDDKKAFYVPINHSYLGVGEQVCEEDAKEAIKKLLKTKLVGHNLKFDLAMAYRFCGIEEITPFCDTMLMAWLLGPDESVSLDNLAKANFGHDMIKYSQTVKLGENFSSVNIEEACKYSAEDAFVTRALYFVLKRKAEKLGFGRIGEILSLIELPFINTLIDMEQTGIKVSPAYLKELGVKTDKEIEVKKGQIFDLSGLVFNPNSTKQLSQVLFEKLGLASKRKTKSGLSTDERALNLIIDEHPIIPVILEYRELFKLKTTYIEPLIELSKNDPKNRIYTSFLQTGTATGRLSSKNPNLQNIPVKTDVGAQIRSAFIADEGKILAGLDYSQIELRLLAHFSGDHTLRDAFLEDRDIHLETSRKIFGSAAAAENRHKAKTINFGLLYGMGSVKLSDTLSIGRDEAKKLIEDYFASFGTVKEYLEGIKSFAMQNGYVETLLGRRRFFDFKNANARDEAMYLREAVNTVFQGSVADIVKLAMNRVRKLIKEESLKARILLQIHDELIFEIDEEEAQPLALVFQSIMQDIYPLSVPLKTSLKFGKNWGELK